MRLQGDLLFAVNFDDIQTADTTVQVRNLDIFAEVALIETVVLYDDLWFSRTCITQVVSDSGVEEFAPGLALPLISRKGVTSITFHAEAVHSRVRGRWIMYLWSKDDNLLELTFTDLSNKAVYWCMAYDSKDGNVVHTHQFIEDNADTSEISEREARDNREQTVLRVAKQHHDVKHLRVLHAPLGFRLEPGTMCQVNIASGELETFTTPHSFREFVARARASKEKKPKNPNQDL